MSKAAGGGVAYWLDMTFDEFVRWIVDVNAAVEEDSERMKKRK